MASPNGPSLSAAELTHMIGSILQVVDNNERRAIETRLSLSLRDPATLVQLATVLCGTTEEGPTASPGVRQMAAVLLRKRVFTLWRALGEAEQAQLRGLLLRQLGAEGTRSVRFALAHVVTRLAKADANNGGGGWPELQQAIRAASEDPRVDMRELAMVLLYSFAEVFVEENALSDLAVESVLRGVADAELVVQTSAVKAAAALLPSLQDQAKTRQTFVSQLVPLCLQILQANAANEGKMSLCVGMLDLLEQLMDDLSVKKYGALLASMSQALMALIANPSHHPRVRTNGGAALVQLVTLKPKFIASHGLLQSLVDVCLGLMAEDDTISLSMEENGLLGEDGEGEDDLDDDEDMLQLSPPCMIGGQLLSAMAGNVASKAFTAALLPFISSVADAPDAVPPRQRKSCMIALACLAEGNPSYLRRRVGYVLSITQHFLKDAEAVPREAAAFALFYFCLHLQPEILTHDEELMPLLIPLLQDGNDLVRRRVGEALDTLCENLQEKMDSYVPALLPAVMGALQNSSLETQCSLCGVLSSMGMTRSPSFTSAGPQLLEMLRQPFAQRTPETMKLRAQVTETVGVVGSAMGKEAFAPYFPSFMTEVVANLQMKHALVREQSFGFLANMCELFRDEFGVYLDDSIACALQTVEEDRAVYKNKHLLARDGGSGGLALGDDFEEGQEEGGEADGDDDAEEIHMRVRTADVEEKAAAVHCLGVFAEVFMSQFGEERVARCWEPLMGLDSNYFPTIRANAMVAAAKLAKASHGVMPPPEPASARTTTDLLSPVVRDRVDELVNTLLRTMEEETEKDIVSAACEALGVLLDYYGAQCMLDNTDALVQDIMRFLRCTMPCQRDDDFDSDEDEDEDELQGGQVDHMYVDGQFVPRPAKGGVYTGGRDVLFRAADEQEQAVTSAIMQAYMNDAAPPAMPTSEAQSWRSTITPEMVTMEMRLPEDHDDEVLEQAAALLESTVRAYGPLFQLYFPFIFPLLEAHADVTTRPPEGLVMATGTLAYSLQALCDRAPPTAAASSSSSAGSGGGHTGSSWTTSSVLHGHQSSASAPALSRQEEDALLVPYAMRALGLSLEVIAHSDESTAKANSSYLLRVLVEGVPSAFADPGTTQQVLQALWSVVSNQEEEIPEAVDNAVSATCSFVRCLVAQQQHGGGGAVPLDQVIPPLMQLLPMRLDKAENSNAVRTLWFLLSSAAEISAVTAQASWLPSVVAAVARMVAAVSVEEGLKRILVEDAVRPFTQQHAAAWQKAKASLSPEEQAALSAAGL